MHLRIDALGKSQLLLRPADDRPEAVDLSRVIGDGLDIRVSRGDIPMITVSIPLLACHVEHVERVR